MQSYAILLGMSEELFTVAEAATRLKIHEGTLRRMLQAGEIKGMKFGAREWRIPDRELQEFIDTKMGRKPAGQKGAPTNE